MRPKYPVKWGSNKVKIRSALVMAAGVGKRMQPITNSIPKPLITLAGSTMLDTNILKLIEHGVERIVINVSYLKEQIIDHVKSSDYYNKAEFIFSIEEVPLEAAGMVQALQYLDDDFYLVNSDIIWIDIDGKPTLLEDLDSRYDNKEIDFLMSVIHLNNVIGFHGNGDFHLNGDIAQIGDVKKEYVFTGISIVNKRLFNDAPKTIFRLFSDHIYKKLLNEKNEIIRAKALVMQSYWIHLTAPESIKEAEDFIKKLTHK